MEIKVTSLHISAGDIETRTIELKKDATLRELFDYLGFSKASVNYKIYYAIKDQYFLQKNTLPYIIINGVLKWNLLNSQVKISDFFSTHNISNNELQILYGFPHADGPMFPSFLQMWHFFYEVIKSIDPISGFLGVSLFSAVNFVGKQIRKYHVPRGLTDVAPSAVFSLIASREHWNSFDFANQVGIELEEAKNLLKTCGYKWDTHKQIYRQSERSKMVIETLNKVRWE